MSSCRNESQYKNTTFINYKHYSVSKELEGYTYWRIKVDSLNVNNFVITTLFDSSLNDGYRHIPKPIDTIRNGSTVISIDTTYLEIIYKVNWGKSPSVMEYYKTVSTLDSSNEFNYFKSKDYLTSKSKYTVYCIGHQDFGKDGDYFMFLNSHFGLIATYSNSWNSLSLQYKVNNKTIPELNSLIDKLALDSTFFPVPVSFRINQIERDNMKFYNTFEIRQLQKMIKKNGL
jgi:hypothetical protein